MLLRLAGALARTANPRYSEYNPLISCDRLKLQARRRSGETFVTPMRKLHMTLFAECPSNPAHLHTRTPSRIDR